MNRKKWLVALLLIALTLTFAACAKNETYTISGKWKFNETLVDLDPEKDSNTYICEKEWSINFTANGVSFDKIEWDYYGYDSHGLIRFYASKSCYRIYDTDELGFDCDVWRTPEYMELDFGDVPQEVDSDFYHWFTANATQL